MIRLDPGYLTKLRLACRTGGQGEAWTQMEHLHTMQN